MDDVAVVALATLEEDAVREIEELVERVSRARGHPALGEPKRLELAHLRSAARGDPSGRDHPHGSTGLMVRGGGGAGLVGYAQLDSGPGRGEFVTELVLAEDADGNLADALLGTAVTTATERAGGPATLRWWIAKPTPADDRRARTFGFVLERELVQMRCALPVGASAGSRPTTRPFRPGSDEEAWLVANNRSFADHPEQGRWDLATLLEREREPWFDPDGFRLLEVDGHLAGSCWTKIHRDADPPLGEIYVIGVDPDFQGRGFGRGLTLAGLDWLSGQGLRVGMLYVDAANSTARDLYRTIGFRDDHVDRAYMGHFGSSGTARDDPQGRERP